MSEKKYPTCKYNICVSGAAETDHCAKNTLEKAKEVGRQITLQGGALITGATTGTPYWAAKGAKEEGGMSIGLSPANSEKEHVEVYKLPVDYFDVIIYTGFDYSGRNLLLTRAADAVILVCGRMGTMNEFTIAYEDHKPIGVLTGVGGTPELIPEIVAKARREPVPIVYDDDPKRLVERLIKIVCEEKLRKRGMPYYKRRG